MVNRSYLGKYIGEDIFKIFLLTIFEYVKQQYSSNRGFDFICKNPRQGFIDKYSQFKLEIGKEYRFDSKSVLIKGCNNSDKWFGWQFNIRYNNIADYFILCGYKDNFNPIHIWVFNKNDIIYGRKFWMRENITIANNPYKLGIFKSYELIDELDIWKNILKSNII